MPVLDCSISADAVGHVHDLLVCLAKFSETVGIEARSDKFTFSALNTSKTAYASFSLDPGAFFLTYSFDGRNSRTPGRFTCQIYNKTLLSAFRSRLAENRNADTPIERCDISVEEDADVTECRMVVAIICKHGLSKIYRLTYESVEVMHALFDRSSATNGWKIAAKVLREYIEFFGPKTEQLDLLAKDGKAIFTSFTEKIMDGKEILKQPLETAISIHAEDFETFGFEEDMHVVISVRDFKAIVTHAETLRSTITANFSRPTKPLQFAYDGYGVRCEFTLMTTGDFRGESSQSTLRPVATRQASQQTNSNSPSRQSAIAPPVSLSKHSTVMPPPAAPASLSAKVQKKSLGTSLLRRNVSRSMQTQDADSLFVPMDKDDDRRWEPPDFDQEDGEEMLGWDASGEMTSQFQATLRDSGSHATSRQATKSSQDDESQGLAPTQRLDQLNGLFD